eukprot:m.17355 g.17355  ORF g.17355 m.17355 type:complete len:889 (+) comp3492_c0_seq1:87-2753(+)
MAPFELIGEQRAPGHAELVEWCPTMDLVAVSTTDNQLVLFRLSWQKVWSRPGKELVAMSSLAWRPDGKVLAVGHTDGSMALLDVEDGEELYVHPPSAVSIKTLHWSERQWPDEAASTGGAVEEGLTSLDPYSMALVDDVDGDEGDVGDDDRASSATEYTDRTANILPPLPPVTETSELTHRPDVLIGKQGFTNVLAVVREDGSMALLCLGVFECGRGNVGVDLSEEGAMVHVAFGPTLNTAFVCVQTGEGVVRAHHVEAPLLSNRPAEAHAVAVQWIHISCLLRYLDAVTSVMKSAWESILIELDAKLAAFSASTGSDGMSGEPKHLEHEFMALLVRGIPSVDLEHFLVRELSPKLKALGTAVESSYKSIQKVAVANFNQAVQALMFRLGDVGGLAAWTDRFAPLALNTVAVETAIGTLGSLTHKSVELVRRIDSSRTSFKAFFSWLNKVVASLDRKAPTDAAAAGGRTDFGQVSAFIEQNFGTARNGDKVSVEHVGQYFDLSPLRTVQEHPQPAWQALLKHLTLDLPEGGGHADILTALESAAVLPAGDGHQGKVATMGAETLVEALGRSVEDVTLEVEWLLEHGMVVEHDECRYSIAHDVVARSKRPLLFPDRSRESLSQVLVALAQEVSSIFQAAAEHDMGTLEISSVLDAEPQAFEGAGVVTQVIQSDASSGADDKGGASFHFVYADGDYSDGTVMIVFKVVASTPVPTTSMAAVSFGGEDTVVQLRGYSGNAVVALLFRDADDDEEPSSTGSTRLAIVPLADLEFRPMGPTDDFDVVLPNAIGAACSADSLDGYLERELVNFVSSGVDVSATRKLASVLDATRRSVYLYDLAAEDDDDDDEEDEDSGDDEQEEENADGDGDQGEGEGEGEDGDADEGDQGDES